ncbi:MAG TPA: hypothetical protein VMF06_15945 [Candidatus Limnocylindria bacterium]|nr:hypothetical protein [Candidatus Limnocylindria bacterium]
MGVSYYVALEAPIEGLDTGMDGKCLASHVEALDEAAAAMGVKPLSEFISANPEQLEEFFENEEENGAALEMPALHYFATTDGLNTVRALIGHPAAHTDGVTEDLRHCLRILEAANKAEVGWRLEVDF